ncbi:hypothetical protein PFICI_08465 [Pestalotiopsis fici W106-1]|uniref:Uncharacterized protein n=1 Tax=Pestalotiopsis fici (strain W106-1 / CGMCC3.15140) TaxID=1229662 RepID=W3X6X7_PESFW|nr:uncharacterized protein PFICI_08465 [Pestalotiopsis fici W106-1]ETS80936.1 hypothetical protein PFICI_08465 [Pestalotiopsis fici W106-1]
MSSPRSANRTSSQFTYHLRRKSYSSPLPHTGSSNTTKRTTLQPHSNSTTINPSPLKMVTTSTNPHYSQQDASSHYMVAEGGSQACGWMESISIEDDDLMFGGKSLSAWHEEGRQKVSYPEEERRGRQRVGVLTQKRFDYSLADQLIRFDNITPTHNNHKILNQQRSPKDSQNSISS